MSEWVNVDRGDAPALPEQCEVLVKSLSSSIQILQSFQLHEAIKETPEVPVVTHDPMLHGILKSVMGPSLWK